MIESRYVVVRTASEASSTGHYGDYTQERIEQDRTPRLPQEDRDRCRCDRGRLSRHHLRPDGHECRQGRPRGRGGRGSGAAAQALTADPNNELTAVADIDEAIVEQAATRLKGSERFGARVKIDRAFFGLDAYDKVINSGVDVVLLATPPGFRPQHLTAAVNANKHVFCEKPCATDSPGVREVIAAQKLAQTKNLALVAGFCWRYNNMIQDAVQQVRNGAIGRLVAHYSTYYTNPVKPMPPESERPAGMSDIEWQIRNWYNFTWLCGDSLVEQAVHNADKIMWIMNDQPPVSAVGVGGRAVPANGGNIYDHFEVNYLFPNGYRVFLANRQSTGCYNAHARLRHGDRRDAAARRRPAADRSAGRPDQVAVPGRGIRHVPART